MRRQAPAALVLVWLAACASGPSPRPGPGVTLGPAHAEPDVVRVVHRVEPGQTLYRIARTYGVSVAALMAANGLVPGAPLTVGQELLIPGAEAPRDVLPPPGGPGPAAGGKAPAALPSGGPAPLARHSPPAALPASRGVLDWPLRGVLYARFGRKGKEPHDGIDLAAPAGTPVKTAGPGHVVYAGEQRGYGLIVIVEHPGGLVTIYAHNRDLRVKSGQTVRAAQVIATVGESGRTSGPHLHFEVRQDGTPVDPLKFLRAPPSA